MPKRARSNSALVLLVAALIGACQQAQPMPIASASGSQAAVASPSEAATSGVTAPPRTPLPTKAASCPPFEPADPQAGSIVETGPTEPMDPPPDPGERMILQGVLLDWQCNLRPDTAFSVWHIDVHGYYGPGQLDGVGPECCWYAADLTTDSEARFEIHSIRPGTQVGSGGERIPHIHASLPFEHANNLDTTILFEGDDRLDGPQPRVVFATRLERRSDADGQYWWGFVVLRL